MVFFVHLRCRYIGATQNGIGWLLRLARWPLLSITTGVVVSPLLKAFPRAFITSPSLVMFWDQGGGDVALSLFLECVEEDGKLLAEPSQDLLQIDPKTPPLVVNGR